MTSKAEKLRRKRGRPVKPDMARTDAGRISRAKEPAEPSDKVAREARMKIFGVCAEDASTAEAATVIGRWSIIGVKGGGISRDQYEALTRFAIGREQYMGSIQAPDSLRSKGAGGSASLDEVQDAESKERIKRRYLAARKAIQDAQNECPGSNLWAVLQYIVIDNMDFSNMIGDTRILGNALHRHYQGIDRKAQIRQLCA